MVALENLEDAYKFRAWKARLLENGLEVHKIEEVYSRRRYNGEVLFSLLMLDASQPEGGKIPPICFLKGEVVCILVCLINAQTGEKFQLLVKQRRIAEGGFTFEHPAGMVDGTQTAEDIAVQEIREETGILIEKSQLIDLSKGKRLFPSTGTSDEAMRLFAIELKMSTEQIESFQNKQTGAVYESEQISTHVYPFTEAHQLVTNTNGLLLNYLYLQHVKDWDLLQNLSL